jgi:hypothetical protein
MVGEGTFCHQLNRQFIAAATAFPREVPWQMVQMNGDPTTRSTSQKRQVQAVRS